MPPVQIVEAQHERRTGIAHENGSRNGLRMMNVTQCDVVPARAENFRRNVPQCSRKDGWNAASVVHAACARPRHEKMRRCDSRRVGGVRGSKPRVEKLGRFTVMTGDAFSPASSSIRFVIVKPGHAHVALPQIRHGGNAEAHPPFSVSNENRLLFGGCPRHRRAHEAEHAARRLKHRQRIVISRRDDRSPKFRKFRRPPQKVEVEPLGGDGRHRRVEDVARENEHVHRLRGHEAEKPVEKPTVVYRAVRVGKRTTEMPVRSVENAQAENR